MTEKLSHYLTSNPGLGVDRHKRLGLSAFPAGPKIEDESVANIFGHSAISFAISEAERRRQPAKDRFTSSLAVEVVWLRIKLRGARYDVILVYTQPARAMDLPHGIIFEVLLGHLWFAFFARADRASYPH